MSTTDEAEVKRLADKIAARGAMTMDCPVSGGCHRAAPGSAGFTAEMTDSELEVRDAEIILSD